jgi:prepilin-type N-terminal cleavage/methylation domain-containing protein
MPPVPANNLVRRRRAFTLIELVTVIVILGVLSSVAVPVYLDYSQDARKAACKGALGGLRAAISNFYLWTGTQAGGGTSRYPTITELTALGTVMSESLPGNPFDKDGTPNNVVDAGSEDKGAVVGSDGGWAYKPATGQIWANTFTKSVGENQF